MNVAYTSLLVFEAVLGLALIALVLLHSPKGEGMGGIGGTATLFTGKRASESGLDKITWTIVILFMIVCVVLGFGFVRP